MNEAIFKNRDRDVFRFFRREAGRFAILTLFGDIDSHMAHHMYVVTRPIECALFELRVRLDDRVRMPEGACQKGVKGGLLGCIAILTQFGHLDSHMGYAHVRCDQVYRTRQVSGVVLSF